MFTLEQIQESYSKVKNSADFPTFMQSLITMGVTGYDLFLADRHAEYFGKQRFSVLEEARYPEYDIAPKWYKDRFLNILTSYRERRLDHVSFYEQLARAGVGKLTLDTRKMTRTYYDRVGNVLHVEELRKP